MNRSAIFVDAGYLFAQGSVVLTGNQRQRQHMMLNVSAASDALKNMSIAASAKELLRIYWYDGSRGGALTPPQKDLAEHENIKLRLGQINSEGQQKGVDALIVTDLIDLARRKAISDAILMSGDEDIRVGVVLAQQEGVRVHLLGIAPAQGNQSTLLRREADTVTEWTESTVRGFLSYQPASAVPVTASDVTIDDHLSALCRELGSDRCASISNIPDRQPIPSDIDSQVLRVGRLLYGAESLSEQQRRDIRLRFRRAARHFVDNHGPND